MPDAIRPNNEAVIVEADSPSVTIWPSAAWTFDSNATLYTGGSYRLTRVRGARAEFKFTGSEVWFYADKNIDHGTYTVQIDDGPAQTQSSYSPDLVMQTVLYTTKVTPGPHTLSITNTDSTFLGVDYFAYMPLAPQSATAAAPAYTALPLPSSTPGGLAAPAGRRPTNGMWVVLDLFFVALALSLVLACCICRQRRRRRRLARDQEQQMAYAAAAAASRVPSSADSLHAAPEPSFLPPWVRGHGMVSVPRAPSTSVGDLGPFADRHAVPAPAYSERRYLQSSEHTPSEVSGTRSTVFSV